MSSLSDLSIDFAKLKSDATQMAEENARLRNINAKMLAALRYVLTFLQEGLPATPILIGRKKPSPRSKMPSLKRSAIPNHRLILSVLQADDGPLFGIVEGAEKFSARHGR
jgi:hypothetical protein